MPDLSTPLLNAANAKLLDPDMDCAGLDLSTHINVMMDEVHPKTDTGETSEGDVHIAANVIYYPEHSTGFCKSDGQHSEHLQPSNLHDSAEVSLFLSLPLS